jgi:hypothetical protein
MLRTASVMLGETAAMATEDGTNVRPQDRRIERKSCMMRRMKPRGAGKG